MTAARREYRFPVLEVEDILEFGTFTENFLLELLGFFDLDFFGLLLSACAHELLRVWLESVSLHMYFKSTGIFAGLVAPRISRTWPVVVIEVVSEQKFLYEVRVDVFPRFQLVIFRAVTLQS